MTEVREILGTPEYVGESDVPHLQTSNPLMHGITAAKKQKQKRVESKGEDLSAQYSEEEV